MALSGKHTVDKWLRKSICFLLVGWLLVRESISSLFCGHAKIDNTVFCFNSSWEHCLKQTMRIIFLISLVFGDHYFIAPTENFYHYTYHLCPQNHCLFFALLSDHDAFGIMIFHQRNGKWFLRPKQRGLNSVDLFIKEPLFLLLTTADCAEETEKSRSRQHWAKNNNFSKIWVDQWSRLLLPINLPNCFGSSYFTAVFFYCSSQFFTTEMKNERYFKKEWCKKSPGWLKSFF